MCHCFFYDLGLFLRTKSLSGQESRHPKAKTLYKSAHYIVNSIMFLANDVA